MKKTRILALLMVGITLIFTGCGRVKAPIANTVDNTEKSDETTVVADTEVGEGSLAAELGTMPLGEYQEVERPSHPADVIPEATFIAKANELENSSLPRIDIKLDSLTISKNDYSAGTIAVTGSDNADIPETEVKVKLRGNSTATLPKIPIKVKFPEKTQLFGGSTEKTWTLLANFYDPTGIHNYVAYSLYEYLTDGTQWVSDITFVDVYVNDIYQGVYMLCDQVEVADTRISMDKDFVGKNPADVDYLIEQDMRTTWDGSGAVEGKDWFWLNRANVAFKFENPDTEDAEYDEHYTAYIKQYMDEAYEACLAKDWDMIQRYIDVDSFINGMITEELTKNQDCNKASLFYSKKAGEKITFATLWDADLSFGSGELGIPDEEEEGIYDNLFFLALLEVPEFHERYEARLGTVIDDASDYMHALITEITNQYGAEFENDYNNWFAAYHVTYCNEEMQGLSYTDQLVYMEDWIDIRVAFLKDRHGL